MSHLRSIGLGLAVGGGLLAVAMLGVYVGLFAGFCGLLCAISHWIRPAFHRFPWPLVTLASLAALVGWTVGGAAPQDALGVALVYLLLHRVVGRSSQRDDRVAVLLAGLMLVASANHTESPLWLLAWGLWALGLPMALLPSEVRGGALTSKRLIGAGALVCAFAAAMLFPMMPRLFGEDQGNVALTGFASEVELGALDTLLDDPGEVFRVSSRGPLPEGPLYFRGVALERFDGRSWRSNGGGAVALHQSPDLDQTAVVMQFSGLAPEGALFTVGQVIYVEAPGTTLRVDQHGAYRMDGTEGLHEWLVVASGPWGPDALVDSGHGPRPGEMLDLPHGLDQRVSDLARNIAGTTRDPALLVAGVTGYLRNQDNFAYTRTPRDAGAEDPLEAFLFERRSGHCEYFSSSAAVLLRVLGVPTRVVNGFVGGELNPLTGGLIVRRYHAHSWVEAWVEGTGWVRVDATPGPGAPAPSMLAQGWLRAQAWWEHGVLGFDQTTQRQAVWSAGSAVETALLRREPTAGRPLAGLLLLWSAAVLMAIWVERVLRGVGRRLAGESAPRPDGPVHLAWFEVERASAGLGLVPPPALPTLSAARWLAEHGPMPADALEELAWLCYRVRYGGEAVADHAERAGQLADEIVRAAQSQATS